jgi:hypothetical protein
MGKRQTESNGARQRVPEVTVSASCKVLGLFSAGGCSKLTLIKIRYGSREHAPGVSRMVLLNLLATNVVVACVVLCGIVPDGAVGRAYGGDADCGGTCASYRDIAAPDGY